MAGMKVIGFLSPGQADVLEPFALLDPEPAAGEVLVRVHAATVNPIDILIRTCPPAEGMRVVGMDAAGVIEKLGPGTDTDLAVGDAVMAIVVPQGTHGAYSEKVALPVESVVRAPEGTSHVEAATLPMNGLTARLALDTLGLAPGQVIAVTGAAGALGGYTIQLAKAEGLTVVADAADKDVELVKELGADVIVPRGDDFTARVREQFPAGVDGLVDGADLKGEVNDALRDGGAVVTISDYQETGERGVTYTFITVPSYSRERAKLDTLRQQAEDGTLTLRVADTFPADQAPEAHRLFEAGGVRGRLVLTF